MVKRYTYRYAEDGDLYRHEEPDGKYVLNSDYAALERERDKLAQEVMRLVNINEQLHERHDALVGAVHKAMDRTADCDKKQTDDQLVADVAYLKRIASDYFKSSHEWRCLAFAAEQKYNALLEAVAWEREVEELCGIIESRYYYVKEIAPEEEEINDSYNAARAAVDALVGEGN